MIGRLLQRRGSSLLRNRCTTSSVQRVTSSAQTARFLSISAADHIENRSSVGANADILPVTELPVHHIAADTDYFSAASVTESGEVLGWYPPELVMESLNFVHTTIGLPWWGTIIATTLALRTFMLPFAISTMQNGARMALMRPELDALTAKIKAQKDATFEQQAESSKKMQGLFTKYNCHPVKSIMGPLVQMPVFMSMFFGLREMSNYYPSISEGGLFWFTDLGIADSTYMLPLLNAASFLIILEVGADGMDNKQMGQMKNVMRGLGVVMVPMTYWLPQGLFLYWITSNSFSLIQTLSFKLPGMKKAFDIPDPPPPPVKTPGSDDDSFNPFKSVVKAAQKQAGFEEPPPPPPEKVVTYSQPPKKKGRKKGKRRGK